MFINTFQYEPEHVKCKNCAAFVKGKGCTERVCPWLAERIKAGTAGYREAVMDSFPRNPHMDARLHTAVRRFTGSLFLTSVHRQRMERLKTWLGYRRRRDTPAFYAVMYLLTANEELYDRTYNCFRKHGLELDYAVLRDMSPHNYTLFSAARDIYTHTSGVMVSDLADAEVADTLAFSLIVNAMLVARYGCSVLKISNREGRK